MSTKKIMIVSFLQALGLAGYCFLIGWGIFNKAEEWFGEMNESFGSMFFLMILVFSVLICGLCVFGYPVSLYLKNNKGSDPIKIVTYTVGWLFLFVVVGGVVLSVA